MSEQMSNNEIVDHFQYSNENHMNKIMNRAIDIKEKRLAEQLSHLSGEEMEKLMDEIDAKRPKCQCPKNEDNIGMLTLEILCWSFLVVAQLKKLTQK